MLTQYTAAALASENKSLVHPASADTIPTSANWEDHVSNGPIAGRQARQIIHNVEMILAIELFAAAQGIDFRRETMPDARSGPWDAARLRTDPVTCAVPGSRHRDVSTYESRSCIGGGQRPAGALRPLLGDCSTTAPMPRAG